MARATTPWMRQMGLHSSWLAIPQLNDALLTLLLARSLAVDDGGGVLPLAVPHWSASSPALHRLYFALCTDGCNQPAFPRSAAHHDVMSPTAE